MVHYRWAILQADSVLENFRELHGDYPKMFEDMINEGNRMLKNHGCFSEIKEWPKLNTQAEQGKQIGFSEKPEAASWVDPYPEIKELLLDFYKEDVELWEELSGEKV